MARSRLNWFSVQQIAEYGERSSPERQRVPERRGLGHEHDLSDGNTASVGESHTGRTRLVEGAAVKRSKSLPQGSFEFFRAVLTRSGTHAGSPST